MSGAPARREHHGPPPPPAQKSLGPIHFPALQVIGRAMGDQVVDIAGHGLPESIFRGVRMRLEQVVLWAGLDKARHGAPRRFLVLLDVGRRPVAILGETIEFFSSSTN